MTPSDIDIHWYNALKLPERKVFWRENPIGGETNITIDGIPDFKMYSTNDDVVVKQLYWTDFKGWELTSLLLWKYITEGGVGHVMDIGSYSGIYSLIASQNNSNLISAFDIQKDCIDRLNMNVEINGITNVNTYNWGLSNENTETEYHYNSEENFLTSIASLHKLKQHNTVAKVKIKTADEVIEKLSKGHKLSAIKIDVEGNELKTLQGLKRTIAADQPHMLIELLRPIYVRQVLPLIPKNYKCYQISEESLTIRPFKKWGINWPIGKNYLFTTDPDLVSSFLSNSRG